MTSKLAIIALTGFGVCAVCLGAAAAIGGNEWRDQGFDLSRLDIGNRPACDLDSEARTDQRQIAWDGSDTVSIAVPGTVHYTPDGSTMLRATGDAALVSHLRVRNGRVELDCNTHFRRSGRALDITLPGRSFRHFSLAGSARVTLDKIDQTDLNLTIAGSGTIEASGKADTTHLVVAGSGDADLGNLSLRDADVKIAGSGGVRMGPTDSADIRIAGSGDVRLLREPKEIHTHIAGSGRISRAGGG